MSFHFGVNIQKLSWDQFIDIADTIERSWGHVYSAEKDLLVGSSKERNILCCLLELKERYPEARFGFSQHTALAKGLSKIAEKGEILISEEIEKIVIDDFKVTCLGMLSIQGMANEILVCKLEEPNKEIIPPKEKPRWPQISRRSQVESLAHHLSVSKALLVVCPTGGGKTVFFNELIDHWQDQKVSYRTTCPSYMRAITFQPVTDLVTQILSIDDIGNTAEKQKKIEQKLKELNIADIATSYLTILDFLSLTDEESILEKVELKTRVQVLTDTVAEIIKRISWNTPVALIIEDAENMDASSTVFMHHLMTKLAEDDISFIFSSYLSHINLPGLHEFELREIEKKDLTKLVEETIGESMSLPPTTPFHVLQYIGLYNEEKLSYLFKQYQGETSIAGFALSFHDVKTIIRRRFENLGNKKNFIANLSIAGTKIQPDEFPLEKENMDLFDYFTKNGYLQKHVNHYTFTNPTLHDEIYELAPHKRNMHIRFADYYSRLDRHEEHAAFHYGEGENYRKAIEYLLLSARQAVRKGGYESGIEYYKKALELCQRKKDAAELELVIALNEGLADVYRALGEEDKALQYYKVVLDSYKEILKE